MRRRARRATRFILGRAIAAWKVSRYSGSGALLDLTGRGHDLTLGSTSGADANDPLHLPFTGTSYLYMPGTSGNYASRVDAAAVSITGDIDLRVRVALTDWTPAVDCSLLGKWTTAGNLSYVLQVLSTGVLRLWWSNDGSTTLYISSTAATGIADGTVKWVRATLDVNDGSGNRVAQFFTSDDGEIWTQLGATVIVAGTTSIFDGAAAVEVGGQTSGTGAQSTGAFYRAQIYNGIGGTLAFDADFTDLSKYASGYGSLTEKSANAATVTLNRSATGAYLEVVDRPMLITHTDDYLAALDAAALDFGAGEDFTAMVAFRYYGAPATSFLMGKKTGLGLAQIGWGLGYVSPSFRVITSDGATQLAQAAPVVSAGVASVLIGTRTSGALQAFVNGAAGASTAGPTGSLANAGGLMLGASNSPSDFARISLFGAALLREALNEGDRARAGQELLAA